MLAEVRGDGLLPLVDVGFIVLIGGGPAMVVLLRPEGGILVLVAVPKDLADLYEV